MTRVIWTVAMACIALMIAACGSSPPVRYFVLEPLDIEYQADPGDSPIVVLGPFELPEYLRRSQMVMRGNGAELLVDDFSRWAEPLEQAIMRTVARNVDSLLGSIAVAAYPTGPLGDAGYRVTGRVDRFDADRDGRIVLALQWSMADADGNILILPQRGEYRAQAAEPGNPAAIAQAMSETITQFSREIAGRIESHLR